MTTAGIQSAVLSMYEIGRAATLVLTALRYAPMSSSAATDSTLTLVLFVDLES
jgi:hypothetical protein